MAEEKASPKQCPYCKTQDEKYLCSQPRIVCYNCRYYYEAKKEQAKYEKEKYQHGSK